MAAMSDEHKQALAEGRAQGRAVRNYLAAQEVETKRGPKLTPDKLRERIAATREAIAAEPDPTRRLQLIQQRLDDEDRLSAADSQVDLEELEAAFVAAAAKYSNRKGISYTAWRELGVPPAVLKKAGVPRTRRAG